MGTDAYTWDANGDLDTRTVAGVATDFTFDHEHNLATATSPAGTTEFVYDANGQRLYQKTPTGSTLYLEGQEVTASPGTTPTVTATRLYTFAGELIATRTAAGGVDYMVTDHQGSVEAKVDANDTVVSARQAYKPYGQPRTSDTFTTQRGWIGQTQDPTTGLDYLNARYYDPNINRFISPDPLYNTAQPKSLNPYTYAWSNPVTASDPSGLLRDCECGSTGPPTGPPPTPCTPGCGINYNGGSGGNTNGGNNGSEYVPYNDPCCVTPDDEWIPEPHINVPADQWPTIDITAPPPDLPCIYINTLGPDLPIGCGDFGPGSFIGDILGGGNGGTGGASNGGLGSGCQDADSFFMCPLPEGLNGPWIDAATDDSGTDTGDSGSPVGVIVDERGVKIVINSRDHGPPHAHVFGGGERTRIGQNGHPLRGDSELSRTQQRVVDDNRTKIRDAIRDYMRWWRINEEGK